MNCKILLLAISLAFLAITCSCVKSQQNSIVKNSAYHWQQTDSSLALMNGENIVWKLNYKKQEGKPYFHPVALTDGTELTWLRPPDHPWHRAIWFSWKYINGLNYWEENRKTGLSQGQTELKTVKVYPDKDYSARIEMTLSYQPPNEPPVLTEKCSLTIGTPDKNGCYYIDWTSTFTTGDKDVFLDRTPTRTKDGRKRSGGYAGLSVRIAKDTSDWQVVDSNGRQGMEANAQSARWLDISFETTSGKSAGITIFDHPQNLRYPTPWYVITRENVPFVYFSPALLYNKPYTLEAGKNLRLCYRILIHPDRANPKRLESIHKDFTDDLLKPS